MKKIISIGGFLVLIFTGGHAVSAYPGDITFKQHDGSTFTGKLKGDEWFHWIEDSKEHIIVFNRATRNYEFAKLIEYNGVDVDLSPSGIPVVTSSRIPKAEAIIPPKIDTKIMYRIWKAKRAQHTEMTKAK